MKFNDMQYLRPNFDELISRGRELVKSVAKADSFEKSLERYAFRYFGKGCCNCRNALPYTHIYRY